MGSLLRSVGLATLAVSNLVSSSALPGALDLSSSEDAQNGVINSTAAFASKSSSGSSASWPLNLHQAVDYYPSQWSESYWEEDAAKMRNASISYVRIGEFDWALFEPQDGVYNWTILDRAFDLLHRHDIKVILGTPAETPPLWAVQNYDILGQDNTRAYRLFGSRHHFSFSSKDYRMLTRRITDKLAQRYGRHPALGAWQLSNEYGCHDTTREFSPKARGAFQGWLQEKYGDIATLNEKQGRVFWSSQFNNFSDIQTPTQEVTESNPGLRLDWFKFSSDQVISFAKESVDIIRRHSDAPITTNFMGGFTDFDLFKFQHVNKLDFAAFDNYPLGNLESQSWQSDANKVAHMRTGDPDFQSLHYALVREMGKGKFGVMEMQPGPVNWATTNPSPLAGMVRLWIHELFAHGASLSNIFRWREVPFAEEQMHAAMLRRDNVEDLAFKEQQEVVADLDKMKEAGLLKDADDGKGDSLAPVWATQRNHSDVAVLYDFTAPWVLEANPQGGSWDTSTFTDYPFVFLELLSNWHTALRRLGLEVDVVGPWSDLSKYKLVVAPTIPMIGSELENALSKYNGSLIVGPRSASKVQTLSIPEGLPPAKGVLRDRLPIKITRVESLRSDGGDVMTNTLDGSDYDVTAWSEWLECYRGSKNATGEPEFRFKGYRDGAPGSCTHTTDDGRKTRYVGWYALQDSMMPVFAKAAQEVGIKTIVGTDPSATDLDLGDSVRYTKHGRALYVVNYSPQQGNVTAIPDGAELVFGGVGGDDSKIAPAGVNLYKLSE
ncbi:unnamed protein product [Jaminaea pallidilutea]